MDFIDQQQLQFYLFWTVVVASIVLAAWIVLPFIGAILSAYILAFIMRPLYLKLIKTNSPTVSSVACIIVAILLVLVPIILVTGGIADQVGDAYQGQGYSKYIKSFLGNPFISPTLEKFNINETKLTADFVSAINEIIDSIFQSIPLIILSLIVTFIGMYYFLKEWNILSDQLIHYLPFKNKEKAVREINKTTSVILYGTLFLAVLEFFVSFIGFSIAGVDASLIMAVFVFILAFIPSIGPMLVWLPLAILYFSFGNYWAVAAIVITGIILTIGIELILFPKWVGEHTRIHPFVMVIGVLGGITVFGIFGFILGPLLLANTLEIIEEAIELE